MIICEWKDHSIEASEWRAKFFINSVFINRANGSINYMQYFTTEKKRIWEVRGIEGSKDFFKKDEVMGYNMPDDVFYLYIDTLQDSDKGLGYESDNNGRTYLYKTIFNVPEQNEMFNNLVNKIDELLLSQIQVFKYDVNGNRVKTKTTLHIEKYDVLQKEQAKERVFKRAYENNVAPPVPKKVETPMYELPPVPNYNEMMANEMMASPPGYTEL